MGTPAEQEQVDHFLNIYPFWNLLKDIVLLLDADGMIIFANKEYTRMLRVELRDIQFTHVDWCNTTWQQIKKEIESKAENIIYFDLNECSPGKKINLQFVQKLPIASTEYYLFQENARIKDSFFSRALLNNSEVGFITINKDYQIEEFNLAAQKITCLISGKELSTGADFSEYLNQIPHQTKFEKHCSTAFSGDYVFFVQNFSTGDLDDTWLEFQFNPITVSSKLVNGVAIVIRDISTYKNIEFEISRSEEIFRNTFNNINDPALLWQKKEDGQIILKTYNIAANTLSHGKIGEWLGTTIQEFYLGLEKVQDIVSEVFSTGYKRTEEVFVKLITTGEEKWFSTDFARISSNFLLDISEDITDRKNADLALAEKQRQYETLLKNLPGMAYRCKNDSAWTMEFVSEGCIDLSGYASDELKDSKEITYAEIIHPDDRDTVWENIQKGLAHQKSFELIYRIITKDKVEKWVWERGQGIENAHGEIFALEGFISDITERVKFEQKAEKARHQAEALQEAMSELASQLDLSQVLRRILLTLKKILDFDSAVLFLKEDETIKVAAARGFTNTASLINKTFPMNNSLLNEVQASGKPLILDDAQQDARFERWEGANLVRGWLCVPLIRHKQFLGFLTIDSYVPGAYQQEDALIAQTFADEAAIVIENARLYEKAQQMATSDGLTGIFNRRYFYEIAKKEFERSQRYNTPLSTIMIDIDHFKYINDTYGHAAGDRVLIQFVERMQAELRNTDILSRYGGEEFAILLPETDSEEAFQVAERLRTVVAKDPFTLQAAKPYITISLGVATNETDVALLDLLIDRSDKALYESKQFGRNRVRSWRRVIS